jgi:hypothetical protein
MIWALAEVQDVTESFEEFPVGKYEISGLAMRCCCASLRAQERQPCRRRAIHSQDHGRPWSATTSTRAYKPRERLRDFLFSKITVNSCGAWRAVSLYCLVIFVCTDSVREYAQFKVDVADLGGYRRLATVV